MNTVSSNLNAGRKIETRKFLVKMCLENSDNFCLFFFVCIPNVPPAITVSSSLYHRTYIFCERYDLDTGIGKDNFAHMSTDISTIILVIYLNDHL